MKVCVFVGPSIPLEEARGELEAEYLPPAAQGDVFHATNRRPNVIALIDGYFARVPAVWHKELLWAMKQGVHVYGSSSMGALRAAELAPFGMVGVGKIFAAFRDGSIEDDDDVAVVHGPPELGHRAMSEAMVNIRFTLAEATRQQLIDGTTVDRLILLAKQQFYAERNWETLLEDARHAGLPPDELSALKQWLPANRVDQKRRDAFALFEKIRADAAEILHEKHVRFHFEHTCYWDQLWITAGAASGAAIATANGTQLHSLEQEVCLTRRGAQLTRTGALARRLAIREFEHRGLEVSPKLIEETATEFRRRLGLKTPADLEGWMQRNDLSREGFLRMMGDEARVRWADRAFDADIRLMLADHLRSTDEYSPLIRRSLEKRETLTRHGIDVNGLTASEVTEEEILRWFFERRLQTALPDDLEAAARDLGFSDATDLKKAMILEWHYCTLLPSAASTEARLPEDVATVPPMSQTIVMTSGTHHDQGDIAPDFTLSDATGNPVSLDKLIGRPTLLLFLPSEGAEGILQPPLAIGEGSEVRLVVLQQGLSGAFSGNRGSIDAIQLIDADRVVYRRFGLSDSGAILLDSAGRIRRRFETITDAEWPVLLAAAVQDLSRAEKERIAPVLIIDDVLSREICDEAIVRWHQGGNRQVGVLRGYGSGERDVIDSTVKRRRDHFLDGHDLLSARIEEFLIRRVYPELARLFFFTPRSREQLRIACYQSADLGFFRAHRDNTKVATSSRRFSVSINLNTGCFEGGDIWFPEFGPRTYYPNSGGALVFPSALLHEVRPVTQGNRFAIITFLLDR